MTKFNLAERLKIIDFYHQHGKKKTQRKWPMLSNGQIKNYLKMGNKYREEIQKGKTKDENLNAKRKGRTWHANERRSRKKHRVGNAGFARCEQYLWLDRITLAWFSNARKLKFAVTPRMIQLFATVECRKQRNEEIRDLNYWYRSFCELNRIVVRRVTGLRRKVYTPEKMQEVSINWGGYVRELKIKRGYKSELIVNVDEIPMYMDMCRGWTLDFAGGQHVDVNFTNSDKLRFTGIAAAAGNGNKLDFSAIFRLTQAGNIPPQFRNGFQHEVQIYCTSGGSNNEESMISWVEDILIPYVEENGGGKDGEYSLLMMDAARSHLAESVRKLLRENRIDIAIIPASTTHIFQLIDVCVGKSFKDKVYEMWAEWMLNENDALGYTAAGNRKHPSLVNCVDWIYQAWQDFDEQIIVRTAPKLFMTADPGPPIEGYESKNYDGDEQVDENEDDLVEADIDE